jgi:hypothetical protein
MVRILNGVIKVHFKTKIRRDALLKMLRSRE